LRQGLVAFRNRGVTLRARRGELRLQRRDIGGKLICALAHMWHRIRFASARKDAICALIQLATALMPLQSDGEHRARAVATNPFRRQARQAGMHSAA